MANENDNTLTATMKVVADVGDESKLRERIANMKRLSAEQKEFNKALKETATIRHNPDLDAAFGMGGSGGGGAGGGGRGPYLPYGGGPSRRAIEMAEQARRAVQDARTRQAMGGWMQHEMQTQRAGEMAEQVRRAVQQSQTQRSMGDWLQWGTIAGRVSDMAEQIRRQNEAVHTGRGMQDWLRQGMHTQRAGEMAQQVLQRVQQAQAQRDMGGWIKQNAGADHYGRLPWGDHHQSEQRMTAAESAAAARIAAQGTDPLSRLSRFRAAATPYAIGATVGVRYAQGAADARNAADIALIRGKTGGDAARAAWESNAISRSILGVSDSFDGRSAKMEEVNVASRKAEGARQGREQMDAFNLDWRMQRRAAEARVKSYQMMPGAAMMDAIDRSTVGGDNRFREAMSRVPIQNEMIDLKRDALRIPIEKTATAMDLKSMEAKGSELTRKLTAAELKQSDDRGNRITGAVLKRVGGGMFDINSAATDAKRADAEEEIKRIQKDITANLAAQTKLKEDMKALDREAIDNTKRQGMNRVELLKLEEQEWQHRADKAMSSAEIFGRKTQLERASSLQSLKTVVGAKSTDYVMQRTLDEVEGIAGDYMKKRYEEAGADTLREANKILPEYFRDPNAKTPQDNAVAKGNEGRKAKAEADKEFFENTNTVVLGPESKRLFEDALKAQNAALLRAIANMIKENNFQIRE